MTEFDGSFTEPRDSSDDELLDDPFALWDAAYVLGSLSSAERREYEAHLNSCALCRIAVSELSGMPALLAQLDGASPETVNKAHDDDQPEPPSPGVEVLTSLMANVSRRRRQSRWRTSAMLAAAAVLAVGLVLALWPGVLGQTGPSQAAGPTLTMTQVAPSHLHASVTLSSYAWGTRVDMACTYGDWSNRDAGAPADRLAMVVVGRNGSRDELATWMGLPGATALPSGNTPTPIDEIGAVQLVSADTGEVLLERNL